MAIKIQNVNVINDDRSFVTLSGTTRPSNPQTGMIWYNTSVGVWEIYSGTAWEELEGGTQGPITGAWAWGWNLLGQLGDGTTTDKNSPVSVVGGFTDWVQISARSGHTAAVRANGTVWAWGAGRFGRLGDGTTTDKNSPVSVVGGFTDWVQVSAGNAHTAAVRANGTVWAWGVNWNGRLGDGTTTDKNSPVSVVGGFTDWVQISAGADHNAAVRANGTVWAWGNNFAGQLGDGTTTDKNSPVSVVGGFTDWVQISGGDSHTAAVRANGTVWAWGSNFAGQLGDNTATGRSSPVSVVGGFTDWVTVNAGGAHTAAVRANGTAWAWGYNSRGGLGDGTETFRTSPVSVVGGFTDWVTVSAGFNHTAAVRANGTAWAWGGNLNGRLGDGTETSRSSPVSVAGGFTDWVTVSAGNHTAAIKR